MSRSLADIWHEKGDLRPTTGGEQLGQNYPNSLASIILAPTKSAKVQMHFGLGEFLDKFLDR